MPDNLELLQTLLRNYFARFQGKAEGPPPDPNDVSIEKRKLENWHEHKLPYPMGDIRLPNETNIVDPGLKQFGHRPLTEIELLMKRYATSVANPRKR